MDLTALSGAGIIALASTALFLLVVKSWHFLARSASGTHFPDSIMREAAQRCRDDLARLNREQSVYLVSALVFAVIFLIFYLLPPQGMFDEVPQWQLIAVLVLLVAAAGFVLVRIGHIVLRTRQLSFVRDANMAVGHALQRITSNRNRVFHDVNTHAGVIDHVIVGLHGIYTISVIAKKAGRRNTVELDGDQLTFAPGKLTMSVERSGRRSEQLAREIRKKTGVDVRVRPVIAVPGWEIESQQSSSYLVVNERNLPMFTGWKDERDYLLNEDVEAVHKMLTARCKRNA